MISPRPSASPRTNAAFLGTESGNVLLMALANVIVVAIVVIIATGLVENSRAQVTYRIDSEARTKLIDRFSALLQSPFIINYSLSACSSPTANAGLKKCIQAGEPSKEPACQSLNIDFCEPDASGNSRKFSGGTTSPVYVDRFGLDCSTEEGPQDSCQFKITTQCSFQCPGNQDGCGLVKRMSCDLEIAPYAAGKILKTFVFSKQTSLPPAAYSVRLSNDLTTFSAVR